MQQRRTLFSTGSLGIKADGHICYAGDSLQDPECGLNAGIGGVLIDRENAHPDYNGLRFQNLWGLLG